MKSDLTAESLDRLFSALGAAVWQMQMVEKALHEFSLFPACIAPRRARGKKVTEEWVEKKLSSRKASISFNRLLATIRRNGWMERGLVDRLDSFRKERNWIAHRIMEQRGDDVHNDSATSLLIQRICAFRDDGIKLQAIIADAVEAEALSLGASKRDIEHHHIRLIMEARDWPEDYPSPQRPRR